MEGYWEKLNTKQKNKSSSNIIQCNKNDKTFTYNNVIIVCAGGINDVDGYPHNFVKKRLDKAIELFIEKKNNSIILVLGGGTYHKSPYINNNGFVVHESTSCAKYLYENGIPDHRIFREWSSYDTIANGFFAFTNYLNYFHCENVFVVSSDFHIDRVKVIFDYFNNLFLKYFNIKYIETISDLDVYTKNERCIRENKSKKNFVKNIVNKIKTPDKFIHWFYTEHKAYMSIIKYEINEKINKTY